MLRICAAILIFASSLVLSVQAQEPPPLTIFQQIFPQPTGQNGYEEIVAAGELLGRSAPLLRNEQDGFSALTLTQKRAILADPPVHDALALFRQGIAKSLHAPRDKPQEAAFKAFRLYRRLGRVLAMEQYVLCADGRVGQALDSLHDGLSMGYALQRDALIGGLVGVAIDSMLIQGMQRNVNQFSEKDCRRMIQMACAWQAAPDPAIEAMSVERDEALKSLESEVPSNSDLPKDQILAAMRARFDHYAANLTKPVWERRPPPSLQGNKLVADYVNNLGRTLDPVFQNAQTVFVRDLAKMQILGVHAAVRLYRWEHDELPGDLQALKLNSLTRDPFTGKPLLYRLTGPVTYELASDGLKPTGP